jgi:uncharacterized membrane protein YdbT with pleckstrin-like domain
MKYIEEHLLPDEKVLYTTTLHWIVWASTALWVFIALAVVSVTGWWIFLIPIVTGINAAINYYTSEFGVTSKRVMMKTGFIRRKSLELLLPKVEGVQVDQGIIGRMLNYGTIVVSGTGGSHTPFPKVQKPMELRRKINELVSGH